MRYNLMIGTNTVEELEKRVDVMTHYLAYFPKYGTSTPKPLWETALIKLYSVAKKTFSMNSFVPTFGEACNTSSQSLILQSHYYFDPALPGRPFHVLLPYTPLEMSWKLC